jgi:hypothetical protein
LILQLRIHSRCKRSPTRSRSREHPLGRPAHGAFFRCFSGSRDIVRKPLRFESRK